MEVFLLGLLASSTLTSLVTESFKNFLQEHGKKVYANTLAGVASLVSSSAISMWYVIMNNLAITSKTIACFVALVALSWLCAMVGYDKVMQAIDQIRGTRKDDQNG